MGETGPVIQVESLFYTYMKGTPFEHQGLQGVSMRVDEGECVAIIGHTGSGKSTLIQHLNALLPVQSGKVIVDGQDLSDPKLDVRALRRKVGLVFQNPEDQIFEPLIGDEIACGPFKMGIPLEEVRERARWAMEMVGLSYDEMVDRPTYALSGGQKRKVALAGILAIRPKILILDEPTSGLDPQSRKEILQRIRHLNREEGMTLLFVSHNLEEVALLADRVYVLSEGRVALEGTPREIFSRPADLEKTRIGMPTTVEIMHRLAERGFPVRRDALTVEEAAREIIRVVPPRR
ncbi:energy-coupling factor transporter ATPase [Thermicanus aegyptius]|uniref:energy-coupling factor transporter ATPase n=1 Tax=Thermicanus aegyptius TaxID=94009 RepID=UPI000411F425|nr:energy-coupling factor transporter ATPase [Thermicanus aegyptius]